MGLLGFYAWWRAADEVGVGRGFRQSLWYVAGALPGILLLWQYQWASFGNPFLPPQNWMALLEWIDVGYKGVGGFSPELFAMLFADPRFGLFVAMPLSILAFFGPWLAWRGKGPVPLRESAVAIGISLALIVFFSTVQYTKLQWVTGIRYLAPLFPFLFLAAVPVLLRLPKILGFLLATLSVVISWSIAMVRSQGSIADNVKHAMLEGFQLPWLTVLSKMTAYLPGIATPLSALPWFILLGVMIVFVWRVRSPWKRLGEGAGD
jgi:hypothetical protein